VQNKSDVSFKRRQTGILDRQNRRGIWKCFLRIYTARYYMQVYTVETCHSVCLSVRPSVTFVYCIETSELVSLSSQCRMRRRLVFSHQRSCSGVLYGQKACILGYRPRVGNGFHLVLAHVLCQRTRLPPTATATLSGCSRCSVTWHSFAAVSHAAAVTPVDLMGYIKR